MVWSVAVIAALAVQTVSAQVRELEHALGHALLRPAGRGVTLTEAGRAAMLQAEQIFQLGAALPDDVARPRFSRSLSMTSSAASSSPSTT